ncbi:MAG: DUF6285 domain-containing protein [Candidatus Binatia bacterium]
MQDRPTVAEMLDAVEHLLSDELVPHLTGSRQFYARVAANVLHMVKRELEQEEEHLATEWTGLDELLGPAERPATHTALRDAIHQRTDALCRRIQCGDADGGPYRAQVLAHVRRTVQDKLLVSNPAWLGQK